MLHGRRVVLGVTGGVAAYKAVDVCRRLVDAGAFVSPVLSATAVRFVGPATFSAVASEPARTSLWGGPEVSPHTALGQRADLVVVAPATARLLAAYAIGMADDLLITTLLATRAPVVVCPAMHTEMWEQAAVRANVETLQERGVVVVGPDAGHLAGGDSGLGRMADPADIVAACVSVLSAGEPGDLDGVRVLVTAGGTREPLDAVRFLANRSSGKQGHAVAAEAAARGARVTLITAADLAAPATVERVDVETAADMEHAVARRGASADVVVMAAAVADFRPKVAAPTKLRTADGVPDVVLEPTTDILASLGEHRRPGQILVGFAAEIGDPRPGAREKLRRKGVDFVVGNDVSAPDVGFGHDTNTVVIVGPDGMGLNVGPADKRAIARAVLDAVVDLRSTM